MSTKTPVTVLSGFLGSGKTTLLKYILENRDGLKVALIVNDMAEINVDATLIKAGVNLSATEEKLVEMQNGCVCCTLREDLLIEVKRLAEENKYDAIIIESTGVGEPVPIAQTFSYQDEESGIDLSRYVRLDTMVTVVDAKNFLNNFGSMESLRDRKWEATEGDERTIVNLLVEQIEFCDVLVVNKISEISPEDIKILRAILKGLQPTAEYIETDWWKVDLKQVVNTGLFNMEKAENSPLWVRELASGGHANHTPETQEYGITSFIYRRSRPFHPERLLHVVEQSWVGVIRSKGVFWLASRHDIGGNWGQAGGSIRVDPAGKWLTTLSKEELQHNSDYLDELSQYALYPYWDRRQELVIITIADNRDEIEQLLDSALLTDEEFAMGPTQWAHYPDRFPRWDIL